jgi:transposase InsO family protein
MTLSKINQKRKVLADDVALARYSVIAPLVCREMEPEEYTAELARARSAIYLFPDGPRRVSSRSIRRWCSYFRNGRSPSEPPGFDALIPDVRSDTGLARNLDQDIIERAIALREEAPSRKTRRLIDLIKSEAKAAKKKIPKICESTLNYHLRARGATRKKLGSKSRIFRRFEHPYRNACWQGDWCDGPWLPHPTKPGEMRKCYLHGLIDDRTRYVPHAEFYFRQNLPCLEDCYRKAVLKGGVPEITYVDNGACYQAKQFKLMTARVGTNLVFATEYSPEGKGKIERWIQTVQDDFMDEAKHSGTQTLAELNTFFWAWLDEVYQTRKHSTTKAVPRDLWVAEAERVKVIAPEKLVDIFLWEEERTVDKSGLFSLDSNKYPVSEHLVREKVQVRFDPFDLSKVRVYHNGRFVEVVSPEKTVSHTHTKAMPRRHDKHAPLESSKAFRRQLSGEYKAKVQETMAALPKQSENSEFLTECGLYDLLKTILARHELRTSEKNLAFEFFQRYVPIAKATAERALTELVGEKGNRLHLRAYLTKIQSALAASKGGQ